MQNDIEYLEAFLIEEYDVHTVFGRDETTGYYEESSMIGMNTGQPIKAQLYQYLHEAGHVAINKSNNSKKKYPFKEYSEDTVGYRVDSMREEVMAWEAGLGIAEILKIDLNEADWRNYYKRHIYAYMKFLTI